MQKLFRNFVLQEKAFKRNVLVEEIGKFIGKKSMKHLDFCLDSDKYINEISWSALILI